MKNKEVFSALIYSVWNGRWCIFLCMTTVLDAVANRVAVAAPIAAALAAAGFCIRDIGTILKASVQCNRPHDGASIPLLRFQHLLLSASQ
jgi:hypothetical protein